MKLLRFTAPLILAALLLALAGCPKVGPNYKPPSTSNLPQAWENTPTIPVNDKPITPDDNLRQWWKTFNDPTLTALVDEAIANNKDLKMALASIMEARGNRASAMGALFPQLGLGAEVERGNFGLQSVNRVMNISQVGPGISYNLDFFGGLRRQLEAQSALLQQSVATYEGAMLTLITAVALEYVNFRQFERLITLTEQTADAQKQLFDLTLIQAKAGIATYLDVMQADSLYKTTLAQVPLYEREKMTSAANLSILVGKSLGDINPMLAIAGKIPIPQNFPILDSPVSVISRRPDVAASERQLAANTALQGVAISQLYPSITLSGLVGLQNATFYPSNMQLWNITAGLTAPILEFGLIRGQIQAADARTWQAFYAYEQVVLSALAEMETALVNCAQETLRRSAVEAAVTSTQINLRLAEMRYNNGIDPFINVLQAQNNLFNLQITLVTSQANEALFAISLYKALGLY